MPLYEYIAEEDGERITLLRSMRQADDPVEDPAGRGRTFRRAHSTFMVGQAAAPSAPQFPAGRCCPCGDPNGPCAS